MTDDRLDDLKQVIVTTVGQSEERIKTEVVSELRAELGGAIEQLRQEMHEGFAGIADVMSSHNDQLDDHETRLTRLESKTA